MKTKIKCVIVAIMLVALVSCSIFALTSCGNKKIFDTEYSFKYAYVCWPDGTSEKLSIDWWTDYEDGEQIQIKTTDGGVYIFHSANCVLATK